MNYPAQLGLTASLSTEVPILMMRFAETEVVPVESADSAGIESGDHPYLIKSA